MTHRCSLHPLVAGVCSSDLASDELNKERECIFAHYSEAIETHFANKSNLIKC